MRDLQKFRATDPDTGETWDFTIGGVYKPTKLARRWARAKRVFWPVKAVGIRVWIYLKRLGLALVGRDLYEVDW